MYYEYLGKVIVVNPQDLPYYEIIHFKYNYWEINWLMFYSLVSSDRTQFYDFDLEKRKDRLG